MITIMAMVTVMKAAMLKNFGKNFLQGLSTNQLRRSHLSLLARSLPSLTLLQSCHSHFALSLSLFAAAEEMSAAPSERRKQSRAAPLPAKSLGTFQGLANLYLRLSHWLPYLVWGSGNPETIGDLQFSDPLPIPSSRLPIQWESAIHL